ncbi:MAG: hypothetical protein P8X67_04075 [Syntrophobacterales bacterium]
MTRPVNLALAKILSAVLTDNYLLSSFKTLCFDFISRKVDFIISSFTLLVAYLSVKG